MKGLFLILAFIWAIAGYFRCLEMEKKTEEEGKKLAEELERREQNEIHQKTCDH